MAKIYKYNINGDYLSSYENSTMAAAELGCDESTIRKAASRDKIAKGFLWKTEVEDIDSPFTPKKLPKILIFDIETTPLEAYIFQKSVWKANVGPDKVISEWFCLTWSAKWLYSDKTMSSRLTSAEVLKEDDKRIITGLWGLFDEADIVVAHNGDGFDVPNMNTRFLVNDLTPPSAYQSIDTLKIARKQFGFTHNGLDALAKVFKIDGKIGTDFNLWRRCKNGETAALKEMEIYNIQDVDLLEKVYFKLRPWIKAHPNIGIYLESDSEKCSNCGGPVVLIKDKFYYTSVGKFPTYRCTNKDCGAISRGRKSIYEKEKRNNLIVSVAR
jgi:hypothetical protein